MPDTLTQLPAYFTAYASLVSGSVKVTFEVQEGVPKKLIDRFTDSIRQYGWLCFLASESEQPEIEPEMVTGSLPEPERKSLSQQLRNQMYHYWRAKNPDADKAGFEAWRKGAMESLIGKYQALAYEVKECADNS